MKNYTTHFTTSTPQSQRIPESNQVPNRAGGWGWEVDDKTRLRRWLLIGTEGPAYYAGQRETARENATAIERLLETDGKLVVDEIVRISEGGNAPKPEPAIMALAMCLKMGDLETRRYAATVVPRVCRTFTHLASLGEAVQVFGKRGWGRVTKRAIASWFEAQTVPDLAYQLVKYRNRQGWTAQDLLRLSHPKATTDEARQLAYMWAVGKGVSGNPLLNERIVQFGALQAAETKEEVARIVRAYNMPWETVPSKWAKDLEVQAALFERMPYMATVRQLGRLSSIGLLKAGSDHVKMAVDRLTDREKLARSRVHPMQLYLAARTYEVGHGLRGKGSWTPVSNIVDALMGAFLASFKYAQPSGKKIVVGVDFSSSMAAPVMDIPGFKATEAAMTLAWVLAKTEPGAQLVAFTTHAHPFDLRGVETRRDLERRQLEVAALMSDGTDCAQPIAFAFQANMDVDAFVILTDEETWAGRVHPLEALSQYRSKTGLPTKIVSVGFAAHGYSIRNRDDAGALAIVGFDDAAPGLIQDFLAHPDPVVPVPAQLQGSTP